MIIHGDCVEVLRGMESNSVDAVVTDPPYGLSDQPVKSLSDRLGGVYLNVVLPDLYHANVSHGSLSEFVGPLDSVTFLDWMGRAFGEKSGVCVPVSPLDFKGGGVVNQEVENAGVSAVSGPDCVLSNISDADSIKLGGNYILNLRHAPDLAGRNGRGRLFRELGLGRIGVLVVIPGDSKFSGFLRTRKPASPSFLCDVVGACDNSQGESCGPSFVVAGARAEVRAVLSFDLRLGTAELLPATSATESDAVFEIVPANPVRADSRAGSLSAKFKPIDLSLVGDSAGGTFTVCFHNELLSELHYTRKGFMGKEWDGDVPSVEIWTECLRVLKPGGHLLAFAGTRTQHRMAVRIEDAGFEIRDLIAWVYGQGFPKSLDVSKAIDKAAGAEREVVGLSVYGDGHIQNSGKSMGYGGCDPSADLRPITAPATEAARKWQGWGTALKPALEPITVARKPLIGTVAENVLAHGTGGINVDGCRVGVDGGTSRSGQAEYPKNPDGTEDRSAGWARTGHEVISISAGRWPANLIHDGSEDVIALFPQTTSCKPYARGSDGSKMHGGGWSKWTPAENNYGDSGSAARFFYCAKASKRDRGDGNNHPTIKPTDLMRYLCRLVTPPNGTVLDPFCGSGSTGKAATLEGFEFIGIEREAEYVEIARARVSAVYQQADLHKETTQTDLFAN
jgi:site-specific DNA-methyltransferase (adenine-specific)